MADENDPESNGDRNDETVETTTDSDVPTDGNSDLDSMVVEAAQEYVAIDSTLDQIDSYLNMLEQKNDDLYLQAQELLESSRQTRLELQQANEGSVQPGGQEDGSKSEKS